MTSDDNNIGSRFKMLRKHLRLTQNEFARELDISGTYISDIEGEKKKPGRDVLVKLSKKLNVNLNYLLSGIGGLFIEPEKNAEDGEIIDPTTIDRNDPEDISRKVKWYIDNVPIVRYAIIEFFLGYLYDKAGIIDAELKNLKFKDE